MKLLLRLKLIGLFLFVSNVSAKEIIIEPGPNAYDEVQEAMILMDEGDTLILKSGNYWFEDGLSLDVANVTIQGDPGTSRNLRLGHFKGLLYSQCKRRCLKSHWS